MNAPTTIMNFFATAAGPRLRCFLENTPVCSVSLLVIIGFLALAANCSGQIVCTGTPEECSRQTADFCSDPNNVPPNLTVIKMVRIRGKLADPTGAEFRNQEGPITIQLRDWKTSVILASETLKEDASFRFDLVPPGKYRLIAVVIEQGKARRVKGFYQPREMSCTDEQECSVTAVLQVASTDNFENFCDPR